jgi:hypothetical protein
MVCIFGSVVAILRTAPFEVAALHVAVVDRRAHVCLGDLGSYASFRRWLKRLAPNWFRGVEANGTAR